MREGVRMNQEIQTILDDLIRKLDQLLVTDPEAGRQARRAIFVALMRQSATNGLPAFPSFKVWEKEVYAWALGVARENVSTAAKLLGVGRATMYRKLRRYSIPFRGAQEG